MPNKTKWTTARINKLRKLAEQGLSYEEIGQKMDLKPASVRVYMHNFDLTKSCANINQNKKYNQQQKNEVLMLRFEMDYKYAEIQAATGVSRSTVYAWCSKERDRRAKLEEIACQNRTKQ